MRQNIVTPCSVRKHPETFCCTLIMRRSRSAWLLSNGDHSNLGANRVLAEKRVFPRLLVYSNTPFIGQVGVSLQGVSLRKLLTSRKVTDEVNRIGHLAEHKNRL